MKELDQAMDDYLKRNPPGSREERKRMKKLAGIKESSDNPKIKEAIDAFKKVVKHIKDNIDGRSE
jgi:uncharacterized protein YneF (UPF0154 family)